MKIPMIVALFVALASPWQACAQENQSAAIIAELAKAYEDETGNPWTMPLGFKHSLFEIAIDALRRTEDPSDPASIRDAIAATDYASVVGPINFQTGPVPNISKTPLVGGQWRIVDGKPVIDIVENGDHPNIAKTADVRLIGN